SQAKHGAPPTELPALLTDRNRPAFFRNNLALAYARALTRRKVYEEALTLLRLVKVDDVVDPAAYYFHRALCEYELLLRDHADTSIDHLFDVQDAPDRYLRVADLMRAEMRSWRDRDLAWVARRMRNIQRRLELKRGGKQTQKMQKEVLVRLDEMIKEIENSNS